MAMDAEKTVRLTVWIPVAALALAVPAYLSRQLWFDEALTVLNFACLDSPADIYRAYVIPNNHILFSIILHYWLRLQPAWCAPDLWLRLPSLFSAVALLWYLGKRFRRMCGAFPLMFALTSLAVSPPFLVYATAVRGYMLGALFSAVAAGTAAEFAASGRIRPFVEYFLASVAAVLTVPSDLAALAGAVLFALPLCGAEFWKKRRFYALALVPVAAMAVAYLPIWRRFVRVAQLGEGWHDRWSSLAAVGLALASAFGVLLLMIPAEWARIFRRGRWRQLWRAVIWLLPFPAAFVFAVAPFPRVYFPLFPLLALTIALALRNCVMKRRGPFSDALRVRLGIVGAVILLSLCPWHQTPVRKTLSPRVGGELGDDFFYGYYLRGEHTPLAVAEELRKLSPGAVYFSFLSDPWANMFYHLTGGGSAEYLFDGPRGEVPTLPVGAVAVLRRDETPEPLEKRFSRRLRPVAATPACRIFTVEAP